MRYRAPEVAHTRELTEAWCRWMESDSWRTEAELPQHVGPILQAIVSHVHFAWIHPFGDGNGRTARAAEFFFLVRSGVPAMSAHLLSDHYQRTRDRYYAELDAARTGIDSFIGYAVSGLADGLREQLDRVVRHQELVAWESYVVEILGKATDVRTRARRQTLAITLAKFDEPVATSALLAAPSLTRFYAAPSERATQARLQRDLQELQRLKLVREVEGGLLTAGVEVLKEYLPFRSERGRK